MFDWDGTLVDTAEATYRCYERVFDSFGIAFDREVYARYYSPNWYHTFRQIGLPEEHWPLADERWLAHFAAEQIDLVDGVHEVLYELSARDVAAAIVTSGTRDRVTREMHAQGVSPRFRECVFGSDVISKKPHPEALLLCIERLGVTPSEAVYIGDSPEDVAMAKAAGVFSIAIPGGYPNREALMAADPDLMAASVREAIKLLM
ncbi:MAG TPA: HAD family hydrolase [Thermoanaerobaculia bacterium]